MISVRVTVLDPKQIEMMQSAEILRRDLQARGLTVAMGATADIELRLDHESLRDGGVEFLHAGRTQHVKLEDAVDKAVQIALEVARA